MKTLKDFVKKIRPDKFVWDKDDIKVEPSTPKPEDRSDKFTWKVGDLVIEPKKIVKKLSDKFTWKDGDLTIHNDKD